jgi:hypothetical protein
MNTETEHQPEAAPDPEVTLRLRLSEVNTIYRHLGKSAYHDVAAVIHKCAGQVGMQLPEPRPHAAMPAVRGTSARN